MADLKESDELVKVATSSVLDTCFSSDGGVKVNAFLACNEDPLCSSSRLKEASLELWPHPETVVEKGLHLMELLKDIAACKGPLSENLRARVDELSKFGPNMAVVKEGCFSPVGKATSLIWKTTTLSGGEAKEDREEEVKGLEVVDNLEGVAPPEMFLHQPINKDLNAECLNEGGYCFVEDSVATSTLFRSELGHLRAPMGRNGVRGGRSFLHGSRGGSVGKAREGHVPSLEAGRGTLVQQPVRTEVIPTRLGKSGGASSSKSSFAGDRGKSKTGEDSTLNPRSNLNSAGHVTQEDKRALMASEDKAPMLAIRDKGLHPMVTYGQIALDQGTRSDLVGYPTHSRVSIQGVIRLGGAGGPSDITSAGFGNKDGKNMG